MLLLSNSNLILDRIQKDQIIFVIQGHLQVDPPKSQLQEKSQQKKYPGSHF